MNAHRDEPARPAADQKPRIIRLRNRLSAVERVAVAARAPKAATFRGSGDVSLRLLSGGGLIITEHGQWTSADGVTLRFSNASEWTFDEDNGIVRLAHTRFGEHRPVHLADLVPLNEDVWVSQAPHLCGADTYVARITATPGALLLRWRVRGPRKSQVIRLRYEPAS